VDGVRWKRSSTEDKVKQGGSNLIMEKKEQYANSCTTVNWEVGIIYRSQQIIKTNRFDRNLI